MDKSAISVYIQSDPLLNSAYVIHKRIASGSFGSVFLVTNKDTQKQMALKLELIKESSVPYLRKEASILKKLSGVPGIPRTYSSGKTEKLAYMQIDLLNKDLSCILRKQTSVGTQFLSEIASKLFRILKQVHQRGILHRDIKPQNIMLDKNNGVYLIDFGISKSTQSEKKQVSTKRHRFVGTPRYASIAAHEKRDQTPRDQIESLLYVLIFLFKKQLPWMNLPQRLGQKTDEILKLKLKTSRKTLCAGLPGYFLQAFNHIDRLQDSKQIDYEYLALIFVEQNRPFPKIRVHFEDEVEFQTPIKHHQLRRMHSQKQKNRNQSYLVLPQQLQKRTSLQQSNLLNVPSNTNLENSSSSNYDSEMNLTQIGQYDSITNLSTEQSVKVDEITFSKAINPSIDEHSTSQESVGLKLRFYSTLHPQRKHHSKRKHTCSSKYS